MFKRNEGNIERGIRLALGMILLGFALTVLSGIAQAVLVILSIVLMVTGLIGYCPLYTVIGLLTKQKDMCPTCSDNEVTR